MNDFDDELRDALRPDDGISPLDPATVIAGAHRRRRLRGLAAAGLASVAVLAVAAGGLLASGNPTGTAPAPAGPPTARTSGPKAGVTPTPPATPSLGPDSRVVTRGATVGPTSTPGGSGTPEPPPVATPDGPEAIAAFMSACRSALQAEDPGPGASAVRKATLAGPDGTLMVFAGSNYWGACDNTYDRPEVSLRRPARMQRPSKNDLTSLAVANDRLTWSGQLYESYWAAGMLPAGVSGVRYTFPDGAGVDATVVGEFWLMQYRSLTPGGNQPSRPKIKVELFGANGGVLATHQLEWGEHTCAQITHGC